jgi:AcrR family transcriptional regulator
VDAALKALDREGDLPSWRALARACGVSQTAPYRHFESLEALAAAVAAECCRRLVEEINAALQATDPLVGPMNYFAEGMRGYVRFGRKHPAWYGLMFGNRFSFDAYPETKKAATDGYASLEAGVLICGVTSARAKSVAYTSWVALHGLVDLLSRIRLRPPDAEETDDEIIAGVIRMVLAHVELEVSG